MLYRTFKVVDKEAVSLLYNGDVRETAVRVAVEHLIERLKEDDKDEPEISMGDTYDDTGEHCIYGEANGKRCFVIYGVRFDIGAVLARVMSHEEYPLDKLLDDEEEQNGKAN